MNPPAEISIELLILLVAISALVAMIVKRINIPYTLALVLVGLLLSFTHAIQPVQLTEDLVLLILLPPLLFEAAWNLDVDCLKQYGALVTLLAVVGLLISVGVIGSLMHLTLGLPLLIALLFGAMVSATDPVSVLALFRQLRIDHRLTTIVEAESLFNDGTAVVVYKLLLALVLMGGAAPVWPVALGGGVLQFLGVVLGGVIVGWLVAQLFGFLSQRYDDHLLELMFTILAAYGSFILADQILVPGVASGIHASGVIATVTAGLIMEKMGRQAMSETTQIVVDSFWEFAAFFVNSLIFLLIGLEIPIGFLIAQWQAIGLAIVTVTLGRMVLVYGLVNIFNQCVGWRKSTSVIPRSWQHTLVWGGLRGALSMALVLSLPRELPERSLLIAMVFGYVLFSLLGQGLSISWLLKKLNLQERRLSGRGSTL